MSISLEENLCLFPPGGPILERAISGEKVLRGLERVLKDLAGISRGLGRGIVAQDGRRALGISLIVLYNKGYDIWA